MMMSVKIEGKLECDDNTRKRTKKELIEGANN